MTSLESIFGVKQVDSKSMDGIQGILQTKDYNTFEIYSDIGTLLHTFVGAKLANKCMPGDHVEWKDDKCMLELRDEYPKIIGTIEYTNKSKYGITTRGLPMYLFTPYNKSYPHFIVGSSEKNTQQNQIALIRFDKWPQMQTFPRGNILQLIGTSGDYDAEYQALLWQACPHTYPKYQYVPQKARDLLPRTNLSGYTFNIDPKGCKDVDDVFTIEHIDTTRWKFTITISDVACYIEDGTAIDIMASLIGQTIYDLNGIVLRPMLPMEYSERTCSLLPEKESFGVSLQMTWDSEKKELTSYQWFESTFVVDRAYSYEEFQEEVSDYRMIVKEIAMYVANTELNDSHKWVEHMMILYNKTAGAMLKQSGMGILRRQSITIAERYIKYENVEPVYSAAEYCLSDDENTVHSGLQTDTYAHSTSPIRRYADLINQRIIKNIITRYNERYIVPITMYDMNIREKQNKRFGRDLFFLSALYEAPNKKVSGVIIDKKDKKDTEKEDMLKVYIYIPSWKRIVSAVYYICPDVENTVWSRDEKRTIDVTYGRSVEIEYGFQLSSRNWKERVIFSIL
jgi:exoribonuclease R